MELEEELEQEVVVDFRLEGICARLSVEDEELLEDELELEDELLELLELLDELLRVGFFQERFPI